MYLNEVYYGNGAYGIQRAAQTYFGKPAKRLTLGESAFLAGLPRGPKLYSPYTSMERAKRRQHAILDTMVRAGWVTALPGRPGKGPANCPGPEAETLPLQGPVFSGLHHPNGDQPIRIEGVRTEGGRLPSTRHWT